MARIVAGAAGGRRLVVPCGRGTRPTSERTREALFSTLEAIHHTLTRRAFLDLYAGSGAVGLEAASRGASPVTLVESNASALRAMRSNVTTLGFSGVNVRTEPVERLLTEQPDVEYDVVFVDPPYAEPVGSVLQLLVTNGWVEADSTIVVERASKSPAPEWPGGWTEDRSRRYGDSTLWYGRRS